MSNDNLTILDVITTFAPAGSSAVTLKSMGSTVGSNTLYVDEDTDPDTRRTGKASFVKGKVAPTAPGGFTRDRSSLSLTQPKVMADLSSNNDIARFELLTSRETTDAEKIKLRYAMAQWIISADADAHFNRGNVQ